jgi:NAD(P)H-flavin reductase
MAGHIFKSRVREIRDVTPEVREFVLSPPHVAFDYQPGQWISLRLPITERPPLVRAYSLLEPSSPFGELKLSLDRVPGGLASEYLFSLEPGVEIEFSGPLGNFVLPEKPDREILWLARYTGVVPFHAMALSLLAEPPPHPVTLVFSAPRPMDLVYLPLFQYLDWLTAVAVVDDPAEGWAGAVGTALELLPDLLESRPPVLPMICGRREFVRPLRDFFYARGYARRDVKWENYD